MRQTIHFFGRNFRCRDVTLPLQMFKRSSLHAGLSPVSPASPPRFGSIHPLTRKASRFPLLMTREYGVNERRDSGLSQFVRVKYREVSHELEGQRSMVNPKVRSEADVEPR